MMKPFTLDTVLDHRKRLEDIAQNRLFEAKRVYEAIENKLNAEKQNLKELIEITEAKQRKGIEITILIQYEFKISTTKQDIDAIKKNLAAKAKVVAQEQENLIYRSKEKQVMERLKEEQNKAWKDYLNKKEAAMLDEIAIMRHLPQQPE